MIGESVREGIAHDEPVETNKQNHTKVVVGTYHIKIHFQ